MSRSLAHNFGWTRALHPQDLQSTMTSLQEAVYKGLPISLEYRALGADGTWHYMRSQGKPQRNMADETLFWYGTAVEISELKALEQQVLTCKAEIRRLRGEGAEQVIAERSTTGLLHRMRTPYDPLHRRTDRS